VSLSLKCHNVDADLAYLGNRDIETPDLWQRTSAAFRSNLTTSLAIDPSPASHDASPVFFKSDGDTVAAHDCLNVLHTGQASNDGPCQALQIALADLLYKQI
jgi:hypothetical protein